MVAKKKAGIPGAKRKSSLKAPSNRRSDPSMGDEVQSYVSQMESLYSALFATMDALTQRLSKNLDEMQKYVNEKGIKEQIKDGNASYVLQSSDLAGFERRNKEVAKSADAIINIPATFLVSLVCKYDAYLGRLLRVIFEKKPEIVNASEKKLTFSDLSDFTSIKAAREAIIEREIEDIIRESHTKQFDWMESHFGLPLRKDLACWPGFVELTERRNLFVHCDGIVSTQYLSVCRTHSVVLPDSVHRGAQLAVSPDYFKQSFTCLFELGVKLGQVLWRKLFPSEFEAADESLNMVCFSLLVDGKYALSRILLEFATGTLKKHSSELNRQRFIVNLAQAHKWEGDQEKCEAILSEHDWTASCLEFQLAIAVLRNDYTKAVSAMREMGKAGRVSKTEYAGWPIFKDFIKSDEFEGGYKAVFGENFIVTEKPAATPTKKTQSRARASTAPRKARTRVSRGR